MPVNPLADRSAAPRATTIELRVAERHGGWEVLVDGHPAATEMVAPALVGVRVGPGVHTVSFIYRGFPDYSQLLILGAVAFVALVVVDRRWRTRNRPQH